MAKREDRQWMFDIKAVTPQDLQAVFSPKTTGLIVSHHTRLNDADEVYPGIFIGNEQSATDSKWLTEAKITHVINTAQGTGKTNCKTNLVPLYRKLNITYTAITADDVPSFNMLPLLTRTNRFLKQALRDSRSNVLVHCKAGVSRSTTVVMSYLMSKCDLNVIQAAQIIKAKRDVNPNSGFLVQLCRLQEQIDQKQRPESPDRMSRSSSCIQS